MRVAMEYLGVEPSYSRPRVSKLAPPGKRDADNSTDCLSSYRHKKVLLLAFH
ncbi:hypothetical protein D9M68_380130 [compost metagenome]